MLEHARSNNGTTKEREGITSQIFFICGYQEPRKTEELYENTTLLSPAPFHLHLWGLLSPLIQCQYEIHQKLAGWKGNVKAKQKHINTLLHRCLPL